MKQGTVLEADRYKYIARVVNKEGKLKDHVQQVRQKSSKLILEINAIGAKSQVGTEKVRGKIKRYETCLVPVMLNGLAAWGKHAGKRYR